VPYALDPELLQAVIAMLGEQGSRPTPAARDDWPRLRADSEATLAGLEAALDARPSVSRTDYQAASYDGSRVLVRWYAPAGHDRSAAGPAAVYLHGGGMILGTVALHDRLVAGYAADSGVPLLAVDYRRAPEHPHPAPAEDAYAGVAWLAAHASELGVDPARIAVMGDSAGAGLAAAAALLARDRGLPLAKQILIYPMLDDRNVTPDPALAPWAGWSYDDNYTGWHALLGDRIAGPDVPAYAAPARAADLSGLPATYVEVGELDIFRDEAIEYARRIALTGTSVELHVHPGCPHGFDRITAQADVVRRARGDRLRALTTIT
jgi:acetyl esterase/lipase